MGFHPTILIKRQGSARPWSGWSTFCPCRGPRSIHCPCPKCSRGLCTTRVRFDIAQDGEPHGIVVHDSSGLPSLDRAAEAAVRDAAPLPWVYGRLEVPVLFSLERRR